MSTVGQQQVRGHSVGVGACISGPNQPLPLGYRGHWRRERNLHDSYKLMIDLSLQILWEKNLSGYSDIEDE